MSQIICEPAKLKSIHIYMTLKSQKNIFTNAIYLLNWNCFIWSCFHILPCFISLAISYVACSINSNYCNYNEQNCFNRCMFGCVRGCVCVYKSFQLNVDFWWLPEKNPCKKSLTRFLKYFALLSSRVERKWLTQYHTASFVPEAALELMVS